MGSDGLALGFYFAVLIAVAAPLGLYMAAVFEGRCTFLTPAILPIEKRVYWICGIDATKEMTWKTYALAFLWFNVIGMVFLFALQMLQRFLPLNPQHLANVRWDTAINTAVSFVTNANWQSYSGEQTMSYLSQMLGLAVQNFVSAGIGMAVLLPLIRGFTRVNSNTVGNFWADMTRATLYILIPLSILWTLLLVSQGVVQTFRPSVAAQTLEGHTQNIAVGPAASQVAIKELGTNGGGFYNANSSHPLENSSPFSNFLQTLALLLIPVATLFMYGRMLKNFKHAWAIFASMAILYFLGLGIILAAELPGSRNLSHAGVLNGLNMEGKEVRFGPTLSALWAQSTTVTSNGSVNSMHDSFMPLSGMVMIFNMAIGEIVFGGVGVGLMSMLFYAIMTMFLAGLMVGRTPEFLGKKLEPYEMIMAAVGMMAAAVAMKIFVAIAIVLPAGLAGLNNAGPHGFSEVLYAYAEAAGNNGSAFAGLNANTPFYNLTLAFVILIGRYATIFPALAIGGALARKKSRPVTVGTFPTHGWLFVAMLVGVVIIFGALTFFPALVLGPFLEHLLMLQGKLF